MNHKPTVIKPRVTVYYHLADKPHALLHSFLAKEFYRLHFDHLGASAPFKSMRGPRKKLSSLSENFEFYIIHR